MKKLFLLIAVAAFTFACGSRAQQAEEKICEEIKTECCEHHENVEEGKICCKDGKPCEGEKNCEKECDHKGKKEGCGEKKEGCGEKKSCGDKSDKKECGKK
jgi:hypothetical protein